MEPWAIRLAEGDSRGAWDLFADRYRRLIIATIRRLVTDGDDVMEVFATVCQALSAHDFARLRRYDAAAVGGASVSTWLVVVVRNLAIDWLRSQHGRTRLTTPAHLTAFQQQIFATICLQGNSYSEAYELLREHFPAPLTFGEFLREVRATHTQAPCSRVVRNETRVNIEQAGLTTEATDLAALSELSGVLEAALAAETTEVRLAIRLLVIDRTPASAIASLLHWPNAKAVYNRVYRALAAARATLDQRGIGRNDLI